ncbi:uncharacterized protein TrAtP1_004887 [Trichoderma atroviride]|uniref:uncharacterized protein n=1 Tax=Hypocrea atroviridis TaxID=63577 RepID=UPI00332D9349|nr:hypothetical protein TrAtP1_004887 [Trichoderma atroviride]
MTLEARTGCCQSASASARVWGTYSECARPQRICLARPWKASASPRSRETPVDAASRGGTAGQGCSRASPVHAAGRLTSHRYPCRRSASFASHPFSALPSLAQRQRQRRARSPLHQPIGRSKPASHQQAESPQVPKSQVYSQVQARLAAPRRRARPSLSAPIRQLVASRESQAPERPRTLSINGHKWP